MRMGSVLAALAVAGLLVACGRQRPAAGPGTAAPAAQPADGAPAAGFVAGSAAGSGASATATAPPPGGAGTPAPPRLLAFRTTTIDGARFDGVSLARRPVALWFWVPWCGTCAGQAATVAQLAERYAGRLSIVGVARLAGLAGLAGLGDGDAMREFVTDTGVGNVTHLNDEAGAVWRRLGITAPGVYVLIDPRGTVVHRGWLDSVQFTERVQALVAAG